MDSAGYVLVYDAAGEPWPSAWTSLGVGVLLVLLGIAFWSAGRFVVKDRSEARSLRWLGAVVVAVSLLASAGMTLEAREYSSFRRSLANGGYVRVEGVVSRYVPGDRGGHADEEWTVVGPGGTYHYSFRASIREPGYRKIRGPVRRGSRVRIADIDGRIARLEVAR